MIPISPGFVGVTDAESIPAVLLRAARGFDTECGL